MAINTEKNSYTILFAVGMVLVVGALLAFTASSLRPNIDENKRLEKQQNILYAMGVNENDESSANFVSTADAPELFKKYIKKQLVIEGDKVTEDDQAYLIDVKKEQANAKAGKVRKLPLLIGEKDGKTYYIAPIRGKGLWDAIWAYIAMDENMVVQGAYFDHKGETPVWVPISNNVSLWTTLLANILRTLTEHLKVLPLLKEMPILRTKTKQIMR